MLPSVGETSRSRCCQALVLANLSGGHLLPEDIGPTSVVRERPLPNGSGSLGRYARASDDPELQQVVITNRPIEFVVEWVEACVSV